MVAHISPITSASSSVEYFSKDGYYAKDDPAHKEASHWHGKGAADLGFDGVVEVDDFAAVMDGKIDEHGIKLGRMRGGKREHRAGHDLTLSCPKSVSIEGLVFGQQEVIDAHQAAVKATLNFIEENFIECRTYDPATKQTKRTPTGKMIAATFTHDTSRNLDPHLHTHCIIANMTMNKDDRWRSIEATALRRHVKLIGSYYHNELAHGLMHSGYHLSPRMIGTLPGYEIEGYNTKTLEDFSTRRQEILDYINERGWRYTPKTAQIAALATRPQKVEIPRSELHQQWQDKAQEIGLTDSAPRYDKNPMPDNPNIYHAIVNGLNDIEQRYSVFAVSELQAHVLGQLAGRVTLDAVTECITQMESDGHLVRAKRRGADLAYVTAATLDVERNIISHVKNGMGQAEPVREKFDSANLDAGLTDSQKQAIEMILTSRDKVVGVQGYAGTGKTTMLKTVVEQSTWLWERTEILGLAPSTSATKVLSDEAKIPARTLQHFLTKFGNIDAMGEAELGKHRKNFARTMLVIDEASMISTKQMNTLFNITEKLDIQHMVLVGDSKQLRSVEAGQPFRQLQNHGMKVAVMDDIMRQKDGDLKLAVEAVLEGNPARSLEHLAGSLVESQKLGHDAAHLWLALDKEARENTILLAPTHDLRGEINMTIRDALKAEGDLSGKELNQDQMINRHMSPREKAEPHYYDAGDVLVFHQKAINYRINAGDHYTVTRVTQDGHLNVENALGETRQIKPASNIRYSYDVYQPSNIDLQKGDRICFTRNNNDSNIANGDDAVISKITPNKVHLIGRGGDKIALKRDDDALKHIDYGYSSTVHRAQGTTADHVIAVLDSGHGQLTDQQSFYVEISRARHSAVVLTDNIEQLTETLEQNTGERMTALEAIGEHGLQAEETHEKEAEKNVDKTEPALDISDKELDTQSLEQTYQEDLFTDKDLGEAETADLEKDEIEKPEKTKELDNEMEM